MVRPWLSCPMHSQPSSQLVSEDHIGQESTGAVRHRFVAHSAQINAFARSVLSIGMVSHFLSERKPFLERTGEGDGAVPTGFLGAGRFSDRAVCLAPVIRNDPGLGSPFEPLRNLIGENGRPVPVPGGGVFGRCDAADEDRLHPCNPRSRGGGSGPGRSVEGHATVRHDLAHECPSRPSANRRSHCGSGDRYVSRRGAHALLTAWSGSRTRRLPWSPRASGT